MTLPTNIIFPLKDHYLQSGDIQDIRSYLLELNFSLQRMYEDIAQAVNGDIRTDFGFQGTLWKPILKGTGVAGTFTYTNQVGWVLRKGLLVDCWFDVTWSASGGAAGNLYVELPYKVAVSNQKPFVGVVQPSGITYTGGTEIVINAIQNSYKGEFWNTGSGFTTANQLVVATGQLIGHIRYIGINDERA